MRSVFILVSILYCSLAWSQVQYTMEKVFTIPQDEEQPYLFGIVEDVVISDQGEIYFLDTQLAEIKVFSIHGEYLRTIGRGGEGPGELLAPGHISLYGEKGIVVASKRQGRVTLLDRYSGDPLGQFRVQGRKSDLAAIGRFEYLGEEMGNPTFGAVTMEPTQEGYYYWIRYLAKFTYREGHSILVPDCEIREVGYNKGKATEQNDYFGIWEPWAISDIGTIILAPYWSRYLIEEVGPEGIVLRSIERDVESLPRSKLEANRYRNMMWGGYDPKEIGLDLVLEDRQAIVRKIFSRSNGEFWVDARFNSQDKEDGAYLLFDHFSLDDGFLGTIEIAGEGNSDLDQYYLGKDGFLLAIHGGDGYIQNLRGKLENVPDYDLEIAGYRLVGVEAGNDE